MQTHDKLIEARVLDNAATTESQVYLSVPDPDNPDRTSKEKEVRYVRCCILIILFLLCSWAPNLILPSLRMVTEHTQTKNPGIAF